MSLPQELYAHEVIQYLPVRDILTLCETSSTLHSICQENSTWKFLIGRDFGIEYEGDNPKEYYMRANYIHEISDIPVKKLKGHEYPALYGDLGGMGYVRRGNVLELSGLDKSNFYKYHYPERIVLRFILSSESKEMDHILPPALHIGFDKSYPAVEISRSDFKDIYQFYSGKRL